MPVETKIIGSYQILELIGQGAIGRTYKARHLLTDSLACVKHCLKISPAHAEILKKEARVLETLAHETIPSFRDLVQLDDGSLALIMNYLEGLTLAQYVEKFGAIAPKHVAWITDRLLNALFYSYHKGIVHGDIKPQNIILCTRHRVGLVDWGIACLKPKADSKSTGFTALFAPPEEILGMTILPESDLYSLGLVMIYALSGKLESVRQKSIPAHVPKAMVDFINQLIIRDLAFRPKWESNLNPFEHFRQVRLVAFGQIHSNLEPLLGLDEEEQKPDGRIL